MQLNATAAANSAQRTGNLNPSEAASTYSAFMQLFLTQLKYQDPTKPVDPATTVAQLATFSQVEQLVQSNQRLDALIVNSGLTQAASFIGKTIESGDGSVRGKIASVTVLAGQLQATLDDGRKLEIAPGVTIS